jgi:hypothetical protein
VAALVDAAAGVCSYFVERGPFAADAKFVKMSVGTTQITSTQKVVSVALALLMLTCQPEPGSAGYSGKPS